MSLPFHQISKETKGQCKIFQLAGASQLRFGTGEKKKTQLRQHQNSNLFEVLFVWILTSFITFIVVIVVSAGARSVLQQT